METLSLILLATYVMYRLAVSIFPSLIEWSIRNSLFAELNWRSSHTQPIPSTGGLIFLLSMSIALLFLENFESFSAILLTYLALFVGWLDDRKDIKWFYKLGVQIGIGAGFYSLGFSVENGHGVLGLNNLTSLQSFTITVFLVASIMNAINLVDGVDGLAGSLTLISFSFFGFWFVLHNELFWGVYAMSIVGLIGAFLKYNFSPARIFMGDSGTLFLGANISLLLLVFLGRGLSHYYLVPVAIISMPLIDMFRLIISRLIQKKSPFKADKNHFHHMLLDTGMSHKSIAYSGAAISIMLAALAVLLNKGNIGLTIVQIFCFGVIVYVWILLKNANKDKLVLLKLKKEVSEMKLNNNLLKFN